ncbi:MAG: histidine phosphatase family protein [Actinomycetota bacterium]|nr:histidine phosphatase family protein [Actinomycetota bacterium]
MDLLILRHGQSEWNAQGKWQGQADPPLTTLGEQQAAAAGHQLRDIGESFDRIVSSDLRRAHRTAEIIAQVVGREDVTVHSEFRERAAGIWQGLTRSEIEASWPNAIAEQRWPKGYEHDDSIISRVMPGLVNLAQSNKRVLLVGHAGLIRALDRATDAPHAAITHHLAGRWYELRDELTPGSVADFSSEAPDHDLE